MLDSTCENTVGKVIEFPSGADLIMAQAVVAGKVSEEKKLFKLASLYIDLNHITSANDIFIEGGPVAQTALAFVEAVCDTIGYHAAQPTGGNVA
jgi:hypothetical protein